MERGGGRVLCLTPKGRKENMGDQLGPRGARAAE